MVGDAVKVVFVPAQIEVVPVAILTDGVTDDDIFPFPVGLLVVGVFVPLPLPPISIPFEGTEASMLFPLQVIVDLISTTNHRYSMLGEPPDAVGVVEKLLNVIDAPGLFMVAINDAPPKLELLER